MRPTVRAGRIGTASACRRVRVHHIRPIVGLTEYRRAFLHIQGEDHRSHVGGAERDAVCLFCIAAISRGHSVFDLGTFAAVQRSSMCRHGFTGGGKQRLTTRPARLPYKQYDARSSLPAARWLNGRCDRKERRHGHNGECLETDRRPSRGRSAVAGVRPLRADQFPGRHGHAVDRRGGPFHCRRPWDQAGGVRSDLLRRPARRCPGRDRVRRVGGPGRAQAAPASRHADHRRLHLAHRARSVARLADPAALLRWSGPRRRDTLLHRADVGICPCPQPGSLGDGDVGRLSRSGP